MSILQLSDLSNEPFVNFDAGSMAQLKTSSPAVKSLREAGQKASNETKRVAGVRFRVPGAPQQTAFDTFESKTVSKNR